MALSAREEAGLTRYAFFDPNVGAWDAIPASSAAGLERALAAHFTPALSERYGAGATLDVFAVRAPPADTVGYRAWQRVRAPLMPLVAQLAQQDRIHGPLQLNDRPVSREALYRGGATVDGQAIRADTAWSPGAIRIPAKPGIGRRAVGPVGTGLRLLWRLSRAIAGVASFRQGRHGDAAFDLGALAAEAVGEGVERGAPRLAAFVPRALRHASSGAAAVGRTAGQLLARGAAMLGTVVTLPFDLYTAITSFRQAESAQGLARQDALFQGGMATLGAAIGVGVAVAAAVSASAATAAGPIGLAAGVLLIAGAQVYSAVRQVQEVEQWISLSASQRLSLGWRYFTQQGMDPHTEKQVLEARAVDKCCKTLKMRQRSCSMPRAHRLARCFIRTRW